MANWSFQKILNLIVSKNPELERSFWMPSIRIEFILMVKFDWRIWRSMKLYIYPITSNFEKVPNFLKEIKIVKESLKAVTFFIFFSTISITAFKGEFSHQTCWEGLYCCEGLLTTFLYYTSNKWAFSPHILWFSLQSPCQNFWYWIFNWAKELLWLCFHRQRFLDSKGTRDFYWWTEFHLPEKNSVFY